MYEQRLAALRASGVDVPMLRERPRLTQFQELAVMAWRDLCGERAIGFGGVGPIPWRAIVAWVDRYDVHDDERFIEVVQAIDVEFLARENKRN